MDHPSSVDRSFLDRRRAGRHVGLYVLPTALAIIVACWVALFAWWPLAVNPWHAVGYFEGQVVEPGTATKYAMTAAVLLNLLLLTVTVAIAIAIGWARTERRYLRLLALTPELPNSSETASSSPAMRKDLETPR
jgi:hypothetical protein